MKRTLLIAVTALFTSSLMAQPTSETFPDFTYTDIDGVEHNLQSYLDQGKTVVIDVFATWCSVCQNSTGGMEELYNTYGQGGDGSIVVLTFERDPNTSNEQTFINNYNIQSPVITEATDVIANEWNVTYQPEYFVICPDGTFNEEAISPVYNDPQDIVDHAMQCAVVSSLTEEDLENGFVLRTNQVDGYLDYTSSFQNLQFRILDLTGATSRQGVFQEGEGSLDLGGLPKGMYLLHLTDGQAVLTKRFIKKS